MRISVSEAKAQLTDLVRRAEEGDEVILTRHRQPVVAMTPIARKPNLDRRRALIEEVRAAAHLAAPGPSAPRSQDILYGDDGLPA